MKDLPEGYISDGCSGGLSKGWKLLFNEAPPFEICCFFHDREYDLGGNSSDRYAADLDLFKCIHESGYPIWAHIVFMAVRFLGAHSFIWKWKHYEYDDKMPK